MNKTDNSTEEKIIKSRVGLLKLARESGNVSQTCKLYVSQEIPFIVTKKLYEIGGEVLGWSDFSRSP